MFLRLSLNAAGLGLAALLGGCISYHEEYSIERGIAETYRAEGIESLRIDFGAGEISIQQGADGEVRVDGTVHVRGRSPERLEEYVNSLSLVRMSDGQYRLAQSESRGRVRYDADLDFGENRKYEWHGPRARYRYANHLTITVPPSADLDVKLNYGSLDADIALPRSARFRMKAGEMDIRLPPSTSALVRAKASVGDVSLYGFDRQDGSVHRKKLIGARYAGAIGRAEDAQEHMLEASVGAGEVSIRGD